VEDELIKMMDTIREAEQNKGTLGDLMSSRGTVKALIVALGIMTFQQTSGVNAVIFYSGKIFENSGCSLSATNASIIIGVVQVSTPFLNGQLRTIQRTEAIHCKSKES
jgi:SP family facilitated glucose transporter-like MFS transporter 8